MKKVLAVSFVVCVLGCGEATEVVQSPAEVEDAVASFLDAYRLAIETRDAALLPTGHAR